MEEKQQNTNTNKQNKKNIYIYIKQNGENKTVIMSERNRKIK